MLALRERTDIGNSRVGKINSQWLYCFMNILFENSLQAIFKIITFIEIGNLFQKLWTINNFWLSNCANHFPDIMGPNGECYEIVSIYKVHTISAHLIQCDSLTC